ncbi:hypothetical protein [Pontibacter mangrovi]|uniref:Uncharacterized protein n=1 Tax=Pontibacter mangrovi TaxID=2589816 RepID=A0A501W6N5_9BACT|nr:hypothetical protein [Pontibacter mangrovi]TPE45563.1 hypothetical protein FJM65_05945 [Pontibacter mangrovi]
MQKAAPGGAAFLFCLALVIFSRMIKDLNKLDLMIAALYLYYRRRYDHWFSAFQTKNFFGLLGLFWLWLKFEWASFILGVPVPNIDDPMYFLGIFAIAWALSGFIIHKFTLSFQELSTIDLYPEEYTRGYKLSFYFMILTLVVFCASLMWLDKQ